jgi:hypothetical protein
MKKILEIVFLSLFMNSFAHADLKGISKMDLLVEDLNKKAISCGVTKEKIETSVKYILSNSRIRIIDKFQRATPTLYIQITVSKNSGLCISNTSLMVYEYTKNSSNRNWGDFIYYTSNGIQSNTEPYFSSFFFDELEERVKRFVVQHSKDNN